MKTKTHEYEGIWLNEINNSFKDSWGSKKAFKTDLSSRLHLREETIDAPNELPIMNRFFGIFDTSISDNDVDIFRLPKEDLLNDYLEEKNADDEEMLIKQEFYNNGTQELTPSLGFEYLRSNGSQNQFSEFGDVEKNLEEQAAAGRDSKKSIKKNKRWGKKQDIELFNEFRKFEQKGLISYQDLKKLQINAGYPSNSIINLIREALKTDKSCEFLTNRLINNTNDNFSIREIKLLKRLIRRSDYKNLDYPKLLENFRGKTLEGLRKACDHLCNGKSHKKLHKITYLDN